MQSRAAGRNPPQTDGQVERHRHARSAMAKLPQVGASIDNYQLRAVVGTGSTATVFLAERGGARVALKVMLPELLWEDAAHQVFDDEAMIGRAVSHPNVALALRRGTWHDLPYLVLELVHGRSYADVLRRAQERNIPLPAGFHLWLLAEACDGLHAAHESVGPGDAPLDVVHRDMKPQNVLVGFDGRCKVVDFGVAAARGRSFRTATGACKGTLAYLSPEQITRPRQVDRRADVWALGVLAWEALAGRRLFKRKHSADTVDAIVRGDIPELSAAVPNVHAAVHDVVMRCLRRDPDARPATASAVSEAFRRAATRLGFNGTRGAVEIMKVLFDEEERCNVDYGAAHVAPPPPLNLSSRSPDEPLVIEEDPTALWIGVEVVRDVECEPPLPARRPPPRPRRSSPPPLPAQSRSSRRSRCPPPPRRGSKPAPTQSDIPAWPEVLLHAAPPLSSTGAAGPPQPMGAASPPPPMGAVRPPIPPSGFGSPRGATASDDMLRHSSATPLVVPLGLLPSAPGAASRLRSLFAAASILMACLITLGVFQMHAAATAPRMHLFAGVGQLGAREAKRLKPLARTVDSRPAPEALDSEQPPLGTLPRASR